MAETASPGDGTLPSRAGALSTGGETDNPSRVAHVDSPGVEPDEPDHVTDSTRPDPKVEGIFDSEPTTVESASGIAEVSSEYRRLLTQENHGLRSPEEHHQQLGSSENQRPGISKHQPLGSLDRHRASACQRLGSALSPGTAGEPSPDVTGA